jgi:hypothetical protein
MTKEDIIRMAREAGEAEGMAEFVFHPVIERFAALVASAEREACARVCDDINAIYKWPQDTAERVASQWCADAIRLREKHD